eukprot:g4878.t1
MAVSTLKQYNHPSKYSRQPSPYDSASWLSKFLFLFVRPLLQRGYKSPLEDEDLDDVPQHDHASVVFEKVSRAWKKEILSGRNSYWHALYSANVVEFYSGGWWTLLESVTRILQPVILGFLLRWFAVDDNNREIVEGLLYAVALIAVAAFQIIVHHRLYYFTMRGGWNARQATCAIVNAKLLRLHSSSLRAATSGKVVNIVSNDVLRFDTFFTRLHFGWSAPFDIIVITFLLHFQIGWYATTACVGFIFCLLPIQLYFSKRFGYRRKVTASHTDKRVLITSEVFAGILSVKASAWEIPFVKMIDFIRRKETSSIFKSMSMKAINAAINFSTPYVAMLIAFTVYTTVEDDDLTVERIFSTMALVHVLRISLGKNLSAWLESFPECLAAVGRIRSFLLLPERKDKDDMNKNYEDEVIDKKKKEKKSKIILDMKNLSFTWNVVYQKNNEIAINNISLQVSRGELCIVSGPTGCGKSALLQAILGELECQNNVSMSQNHQNIKKTERSTWLIENGKKCTIAYASQKSWIRAGSVRDNIIWTHPFDLDWYNTVVDACSLREDFTQLPNGDKTEIGERGVNLSGGQKARLGLARAIYAKADLLLLDDPLAACDPSVGSTIFKQAIIGLLGQQQSACILVTHQIHLLPQSDIVVAMSNGGIIDGVGPYKELLEQGLTFDFGVSDFKSSTPRLKGRSVSMSSVGSDISEISLHEKETSEKETTEKNGKSKNTNALVVAEERVKGVVASSTYRHYLQSGGITSFIILTTLFIGGQSLALLADFWLKLWAEAAPEEQEEKDIGSKFFIFAVLTGCATITAFLRSFLFFSVTLQASTSAHNKALRRVLGSPLSFFSANPLGRILNKFSSDLGQVDELLPSVLFDCFESLMLCIGAAALCCIAVPWLILMMFPICYILLKLRQFFVASSRELKRLESLTKSPIFVAFSNNLDGLLTIRAFNCEEYSQSTFLDHLETNGRCWYAWLLVNRWVGVNLDIVSFAVLSMTTLLGVILSESVDAGMLGFAVTYAIQLSGVFQYTVRLSAKAETMMTSFERLSAYAKLPCEPGSSLGNEKNSKHSKPKMQHCQGAIEFDNVSVRYRKDLPPVLKEITTKWNAGEKIGIVGRTGSGKSTLALSLCRLNEIYKGILRIDGVDTSTLQLSELRRLIGFIPQDPIMFTGTLRFNLDPFNACSDQEIWNALESVGLSKNRFFDKRENESDDVVGLDMLIQEGGSNLSIGQRQSISMARAILRDAKIYVLDEATASVDYALDGLIQKLIRKVFVDKTVVTIAHRIKTIQDSDRIVVVDNGHIVETGSPETLLKKKNGHFSSLVHASTLK